MLFRSATIGSMDSSSYIGVTWFNYLMTDEDFRNKARTRWNDVRDTMVNAALGTIDAYKPMVIPSAEENFEIWNTLGVANGFQPLTIKTATPILTRCCISGSSSTTAQSGSTKIYKHIPAEHLRG